MAMTIIAYFKVIITLKILRLIQRALRNLSQKLLKASEGKKYNKEEIIKRRVQMEHQQKVDEFLRNSSFHKKTI